MASKEIHTEHWNLDTRPESILGKGAYGIVYRATDSGGRAVAAKMIDGKKHPRVLDQNFDRLLELNHQNVVRIFDVSRQAKTVYLFMEFCAFGDMNMFFRKQELKMVHKLEMMRQMARGVYYLHMKDVIHRDIKPDNILIAQRTPLCVKLTDFDVSKILDPEIETSAMTSNVGTQAVKAPEFFQRNDKKKICYHRNVDVYAAGLTFLGMIQYKKGDVMIVPRIETPRFDSELHQPIGQLIAERIKYDVTELNIVAVDEPLEGAAGVTDPLQDVRTLIASMTCVEPERRLPAENVVTWLQDISKVGIPTITTQSSTTPNVKKVNNRKIKTRKLLFLLQTARLPWLVEVEKGKIYRLPILALNVVSYGGDKILFNSLPLFCGISLMTISSGTSLVIQAACPHRSSVCGLLNYAVQACQSCHCIRMYNMPSETSIDVARYYQPTAMCPGPDDTLIVIDASFKLQRLQWDEERQELDTIYTIQTSISQPIQDTIYAEEANALVLATKTQGYEGCVEAIHVPQEAQGDQPGIAEVVWTVKTFEGVNILPCGICAGPGRRVFVVDGMNQVLMLDALNGHVLQKLKFDNIIRDICWIQSSSSLGILCPGKSTSTLRCYTVKDASSVSV